MSEDTTTARILDALQCDHPGCVCHKSAANGRGNTHCAAHDDSSASLSVSPPARTAWPLMRCFAGCSHKAIVSALRDRDILPRRTDFRVGAHVHTRTDLLDGSKLVKWDQGAKSTAALYLGDTLADLEPGTTVLLCEGETAAEAAVALGFHAVATACGASSTPDALALAPLRGFNIALCPDNDEPGRQHMTNIAQALAKLGIPCRRLDVPGLPPKGDLADYVGSPDSLAALVATAPKWEPERAPIPCQSARVDWATFWAGDPKSEDWLIEPIIPRGRQVAMYSPAKQGKSLFALDVAVRAATGQRVLDRPAGNPLNVVYVDMEMTEGDLYERLEDMGYGPDSDLSHLHYYLLPSLPPLDTPEGGLALLAIARHHHADLVVVDTTSRVLDGAENDADTLRSFYMYTGLSLKADGIALWRLDHAGKDLGKGQRGTSAKNDDVDLVWELLAQDDGIRLRATHRRQSWIPDTVDLLRLEDPLRHERASRTWPAGTADTARQLDRLGADLDISFRAARDLLSEHKIKVRNTTISSALKYRKSVPQESGNTSSDPNGEHLGEQSEIRFGEHLGERGEHPLADIGEQCSPLMGEHVPSPPPTRVFEPSDPHPCEGCGEPITGTAAKCFDCAAAAALARGGRK